ncbi:class I SAM-dependent methyltransferase [Glaesserella sp.]|uniref:class I SAM-dependent methyltransferase n=1 Tax=Glaesserella sp. TaxID=2094731 RepID=UPI0035A0BD4C
MNAGNKFLFNVDWFSHNIPSLEKIIQDIKPKRILEIGSFEGRSTTFFIESSIAYTNEFEIHCIDSWEGGKEHIGQWNMSSIEEVFEHNIKLQLSKLSYNVSVTKDKGYSHDRMINLIANGYSNYFDFIYVDGSHEAPDVLFDALLAHRLVRVGGVIVFDDYLWSPNKKIEDDHYLLVKPAVDHYVNTFQRKLHVIQMMPLYQLYVMKLAD